MMVLGVSVLASAQIADHNLQELKIDVKHPIDICEVSLIIDDTVYPVSSHQINGSTITLYLADYQAYMIIINCEDYLGICTNGEVIDERDLSVSADVDYQFENGILVFNY